MSNIQRSRSYPEDLKNATQREHKERKDHVEILVESLDKFREKDYERTARLATLGSPSSKDVAIVHYKGCDKCCKVFVRFANYMLERGEEEQRQDSAIQQKSYAGFYYFLKWFSRSILLLLFTTVGNVIGKEIGCEIKDHTTCSDNTFSLVESSPHVVASLIGMVIGLIMGQWLGRWIWDKSAETIQKCLRKCEKCADRTKMSLIFISGFIYLTGMVIFAAIFHEFVHITDDSNNVVGACVGGLIGLICAVLAYRKKSDCTTIQETPQIKPQMTSSQILPPKLSLNS